MSIDLGPIKATYHHHAPETSREAAEEAALTRNQHARDMLDAYWNSPDGLTADEASHAAHVSILYGRPVVTRLRKCGYLDYATLHDGTPIRRLNESGKAARVLQITGKGLDALRDAP